MGPIVGVDLGATNVRAAAVSERGETGPLLKRPVPEGRAPEAVAAAVAALAGEAAGGGPPAAVGVGLAGWLDRGTGLVRVGPNLGFRDVPFGAMLAARLEGARVALVNDLRAIAWGEHRFGAGAGAEVLLVVFMGSGIGSSVVIGGRPLEGAANVACEIGHTRVVPRGGRACGCGQLGCLEAYVGGHNIERRARADVALGVRTAALDAAGGRPEALTCAALEAAAAAGDPYATELWAEVAGYTAQALGSLLTYLNPDRLLLGGGVWEGSPTLRALVLERLPREASPTAYETCRIERPTLGDRAGILGAADFAREALAAPRP